LAEYEWGFPRENTNGNDDNGDLAKSASLEMELPRENTRRFTMRKFELLTVGNAGNDENGQYFIVPLPFLQEWNRNPVELDLLQVATHHLG